MDLPSPSDVGPEPLRTEPSRSENFAAAEFRREGLRNIGKSRLKQKVHQSVLGLGEHNDKIPNQMGKTGKNYKTQ